ncbi:MAG: fluoride efflux transporter CrcB [Methanosarcinaceae archaeon]|nr:fluoride efflux transporter CrcB [Methanosarcinaceae archaeon]
MVFSRAHITNLLFIGTGGFFGAIARFSVAGTITSPLDTLFVNVLGSFMLGVLMYDTEYLGYVNPRTRMAVGVGFLGSFTTFSTFAVQSYQLHGYLAAANIAANVGLAVFAVLLGRAAVIHLSTRSR